MSLAKQLIKTLLRAAKANEAAKATACNGVHFNDYDGGDSLYRAANYRRSRAARAARYALKEQHLREALDLAAEVGIEFGTKHDAETGNIVYFVLTTGQVSFHSKVQFSAAGRKAPVFSGEFDGIHGRTILRLNAALEVERGKLTLSDYLASEAAESMTQEIIREQAEWVRACETTLGRTYTMPDGSREFPAFAGYPANRI